MPLLTSKDNMTKNCRTCDCDGVLVQIFEHDQGGGYPFWKLLWGSSHKNQLQNLILKSSKLLKKFQIKKNPKNFDVFTQTLANNFKGQGHLLKF